VTQSNNSYGHNFEFPEWSEFEVRILDHTEDIAKRIFNGGYLDITADVLNVFNVFKLCGCGNTVFSNGGTTNVAAINQGILTAANSPTMQAFNPFTETPVEGVHWAKRPNFATAVNQFSHPTPRVFRFSFGARF